MRLSPLFIGRVIPPSGPVDTTAPILSRAAAIQTGLTTGAGTVYTNETGGTLYWYVSTSATPPSILEHKAGTNSVTFGSQSV